MDSKNANRIWYNDNATAAKFLMGGIGTGNFSIGSRGQLCDWELFNRPNAGGKLSQTFFALRTEDGIGTAQVRVMESKIRPPYESAQGLSVWDFAGIPRFETARIAGEVSKAFVELRDRRLPVDVDLTAFTPFIPLDADRSGIPAAVLRYRIKNRENRKIKVSVAGSLINAVGFSGYARFGSVKNDGEPKNEFRESGAVKGLFYTNDALPEGHLTAGSMAFTTTTEHVTAKPEWVDSGWWDGAHDFWNDFTDDGQLTPVPSQEDVTYAVNTTSGGMKIGALCVDFELEGLEEKEIPFILSWYFPNRPARWPGQLFFDPEDTDDGRRVKNYYARLFADAWSVNEYMAKHLPTLEKQSDDFREALYQTTLPTPMLDAMAANLTTLRSSTCFRIQDGTFLGWEGCFDDSGCCEGSCSHVWNYQQALAFLFPELERSMRRVNFLLETDEEGEMSYRSNAVFGFERFRKIPPAADGQMGTIVQLYRDWKLSGDDAFLKEMWGGATRALDYAFKKWDTDGDFVFDGEQHNTYDIEFYGATSMTNSIFYAALKAGEEIAAYLGETERAQRYRRAREAGAKKMDEMLFNGEYYIQKLDRSAGHAYQYYDGCLSDQVFGQEIAHIAGLGDVLPKEHVRRALQSIFRYNFRPDLSEHINVQRVYGLNDDGGLVNCTWPHSQKPAVPFVYSDEVWSGIEYQVATHMIYEGFFREAERIVATARQRYDGIKRNPWNEVECGSHYVRAMSSWGLLIAASGYRYDLAAREIAFDPRFSEDDFTCFFSNGKAWGLYRQKKDPATGKIQRKIKTLYGSMEGIALVDKE